MSRCSDVDRCVFDTSCELHRDCAVYGVPMSAALLSALAGMWLALDAVDWVPHGDDGVAVGVRGYAALTAAYERVCQHSEELSSLAESYVSPESRGEVPDASQP